MPINKLLIPIGGMIALSGFISAPLALIFGLLLALIFGNPYADKTKPLATWLMAIAIVGLGAGVPLKEVLEVGAHGIFYTIAGIAFTFLCGLSLGKFLKLSDETSILVTSGTAICGGSAIAAISQVISARHESIAVSLGVVFLLNALALITFPLVGDFFELSQTQFGLWAGLAIHDTSSVIGAALQYGDEAAQIATTTKLARAIWIIPLAFIIGMTWKREESNLPFKSVLKRCWFIAGFLIMACVTTYLPQLVTVAPYIEAGAKRVMILVLFLIGLGLTRQLLREVGFKPLMQGALLWITVSLATLCAILLDVISLN